MARGKLQTLTEQMFYTLLCLKEESYGTDIMKKAALLTDHRVKIGSGTLYNLIEQFLDYGLIKETKVEGRKRSYVLTEEGRLVLEGEYRRLNTLIDDYKAIMED